MVEMICTSTQKLVDELVIMIDSSPIRSSKSSLWFKVKVRIRDEINKCNQIKNLLQKLKTHLVGFLPMIWRNDSY
jgi:hypothetical protein